MANLRISQLPVGGPLQAGDQFPINRAGANFRVSGLVPLASPALTGTPTVNGVSLLAASQLLETTVTITPAQFMAMDHTAGNAVTVIAAPGAGNGILVDWYSMNLQYASAPYATGSNALKLMYGATGFNIAGNTISGSSFNKGSSALFWIQGAIPNTTISSNIVNQALVADIVATPSYTSGDSPIVIMVRYRIVSGLV